MPPGSSTALTRSKTYCLASVMSVASSKVATTCENPNFDADRTLTRPGSPPMDSSMGRVICCSISPGLSAGATVLICTCTGVVSGNASTGSMVRRHTPSAQRAAVNSRTISRFLSESSTSRASMRALRGPGAGRPGFSGRRSRRPAAT